MAAPAKSAFIQAMNSVDQTKLGVNGSTVYTDDGVGDSRVVLFTSGVRGTEYSFLVKHLVEIVKKNALDAWLLTFQARDIRGGKGERQLFYQMLKIMVSLRPQDESKAMLKLIPEYGSWLDIIHLIKTHINQENKFLISMIREQIESDMKAMAENKSVSLLGKWLPREKSADKQVAYLIAGSTLDKPKAERAYIMTQYRKKIVELNKYLKTVEIDMCGKTWSEIKPSSVPGICLNKNKTAFLNQTLKTKLQRSEDPDRIKCAENFKAHMAAVARGEATVKGGDTVFPHNVTTKIVHASEEERSVLEAQWSAIRAASAGLKRCVVLSDVSGSMNGTPMDISIALGILISEVNCAAFKDHVMTFESTPSWVDLSACKSLVEKVLVLGRAPWGGSTNFEAALDKILQKMVAADLPQEEAPEDLLVLTDMGFDAAGGRGFHLDEMKAKWTAAGYKVPRIIIWNLRAAFKDYHAKADTEGIVTVSGWSPSILKVLAAGDLEISTPYKVMRAALDAARYDAVRAAFAEAPYSLTEAQTAFTESQKNEA